ncbi:MAG TPA: FAD-dependent oxidoreductase, partial [Lachnospiraceae bacterium]|nr:FAD-dependent oxidoreductase [Lachnospiraceae bacterium]
KVVKRLTAGVEALLKSNGVEMYSGEAFIHPDKTVSAGNVKVSADKVIFAGGSKAVKINIPGIELEHVLTSDEILDLDHVPKRLVIIGGGVIGVELASVFAAFGSKVAIIELMDNVLPMMDNDISSAICKSLNKKGIKTYTGTKLEKIEEADGYLKVYSDKQEPIDTEYVLLSIGRIPDLTAIQELDLDKDSGRIKVDDTMRSSLDWLYAPGDINGRSMLAHSAFKMGETAAENAMGHSKKVNLSYVPSCVYTSPEVGSVGMTEQQAQTNYDVSIGMFPFQANGRALASGEIEGYVKVITDKKYGEVLGVHIVGPSATELINEAAALMSMEVTANEIADIIHAHPTYAEAFMEAAADSISECLHLPKNK